MISRRQRRKKNFDILGGLLIGVLVLLALGVGVYKEFKSRQAGIDTATLCPRNGPIAKTVILVDKSETYTPLERESILGKLRDISSAIKRHEALELYVVDGIEQSVLRPLIFLCNPGRGKDVDPLIANPRRTEKFWQQRFFQKIEHAFNAVTGNSGARKSPIMESIKSVAVTSFLSVQDPNIPKDLIIISDLVQYVPTYSQYKKPISYESFKASPYGSTSLTNLQDAKVEVLYLRRAALAEIQGKAHIKFWEKWFADSNGTLVHVVSLP
jgi:hypothetical protein